MGYWKAAQCLAVRSGRAPPVGTQADLSRAPSLPPRLSIQGQRCLADNLVNRLPSVAFGSPPSGADLLGATLASNAPNVFCRLAAKLAVAVHPKAVAPSDPPPRNAPKFEPGQSTPKRGVWLYLHRLEPICWARRLQRMHRVYFGGLWRSLWSRCIPQGGGTIRPSATERPQVEPGQSTPKRGVWL